MTLAVDLVEAASGLLFLLLAAFVARSRPRTRVNAALSVYAAGFGATFFIWGVARAFLSDAPLPAWLWWLVAGCVAIVPPAVVVLAASAPRPLEARERRFAGVAVGVGVTTALAVGVGWLRDGLVATPEQIAVFVAVAAAIGSGIGFSTLLALRFRAARAEDRQFRTLAALLAASMLLPNGMDAGANLVPLATWYGLVLAAANAAVASLWLRNAGREGSRLALAVTWTALGSVLAAMLLTVASVDLGATAFSIARVLAVALLVYGILRHQLLGIDVKLRFAISRSTVAAAFVAAFFLASEGAQILFGAGNEWVGLVAAGALVFAIAPLQRAAERLAERAVPMATAAAAPSGGRAADEETYRVTLRKYLVDSKLTREEEGHLARLATRLGIEAERAHALRAEVEAHPTPREVL